MTFVIQCIIKRIMIGTKKNKIISLRLASKLHKKLQKYSAKTEIPVSIIVRKLISEKLKRFK